MIPAPPDVHAFSVGVYSDGDLVLVNPLELGEGTCRLDRAQVEILYGFLKAFVPASA